MVPVTDYPVKSDHYGILRNGLGYNSSHPNNSILPYLHIGKNRDIHTDPNIIPDDDLTGYFCIIVWKELI